MGSLFSCKKVQKKLMTVIENQFLKRMPIHPVKPFLTQRLERSKTNILVACGYAIFYLILR